LPHRGGEDLRVVEDVRELGYSVVPDAIAQTECDRLLANLSAATFRRSRAGARHLLSDAAVRELATASTLQHLASAVLASEAFPFRATLFDKSITSNWSVVWHQDTALPLQNRFESPGWGPWSVKAGIHYAHAPAAALERVVAVRFHFDESTSENGPLRVLPGTHRLGVLSDQKVADLARREKGIPCLVPQCGVLVMRPLLIHASSKSDGMKRRRVLHIEYSASPDILPGIALAVA
jgi:ectoine hydroxylase-related dioxygenase (phytanoyl-CoA dioxygenase family)